MHFSWGSNNTTTAAEKEQEATLRAMLDARCEIVSQDLKKIDEDSKRELREAKRAYKQLEHEIKLAACRRKAERIRDEMESIQATDEYKRSDHKIKRCIEYIWSWVEWGLEASMKKQEKELKKYDHYCNSAVCSDQASETETLSEKTALKKLDAIC
ncbi:hypothetical protein BGW42_000610 [Actinomortierella wolfii]|nr:hypothetical protein BGW42_000610 [Actinomortierella wolfii]